MDNQMDLDNIKSLVPETVYTDDGEPADYPAPPPIYGNSLAVPVVDLEAGQQILDTSLQASSSNTQAISRGDKAVLIIAVVLAVIAIVLMVHLGA